MTNKTYHEKLYGLINKFVHEVYDTTRNFPKEELFGVTSQFRRAALSVMLNYVEGYARQRRAVLKNFLEISYGSLKESKYLVQFSCERKYLSDEESKSLIKLADEIGAMLWGILAKLR